MLSLLSVVSGVGRDAYGAFLKTVAFMSSVKNSCDVNSSPLARTLKWMWTARPRVPARVDRRERDLPARVRGLVAAQPPLAAGPVRRLVGVLAGGVAVPDVDGRALHRRAVVVGVEHEHRQHELRAVLALADVAAVELLVDEVRPLGLGRRHDAGRSHRLLDAVVERPFATGRMPPIRQRTPVAPAAPIAARLVISVMARNDDARGCEKAGSQLRNP